MKRTLRRTLLGALPVGLLCLLLYVFVISPARERAERQSLAEIHMLKQIEVSVEQHLYAGGDLPINWLDASNVVNWQLVTGICRRYSLPPPDNLYGWLREPVFFNDGSYTGRVFLVRSIPCKRPKRQVGRWGLMRGHRLQVANNSRFGGLSDDVYQVWIGENELPMAIRSQLTNQPAN